MYSKYAKILSRGFSMLMLLGLLLQPWSGYSVYAAPGDIARVSVSSSGAEADAMTYSGDISADGNFVVFDSEAGNLVAGDTNGTGDVFLHDRQLHTTVRVSVDATGGQVDGGGGAASVSADGRFVAFESGATNLVAGDTNTFTDIFVKNMQSGAVTRVTVDSSGVEANNDSSSPSISGDGRYVAFVSDASNLAANDVSGVADIFVHDLQTGTTVRASVDGNASSWDPSISLDGHFVVFSSGATNLVTGDTNGVRDIFVYAVQTGQVTLASVNSSGVQADKGGVDPSISGDGRYVAFSSAAYNLQTVDTLNFTYVYVHDRTTGETTLASYNNGYPMYGTADDPVISADGRYIAFSYDDRGDGMAVRWIYVHDRVTNTTVLPTTGGSSDDNATPLLPSISGDGRFLAYASSSNKLVPGDTNGVRDIFVKEVAYPVDAVPTVVSSEHGCPSECSGPADQMVDFLVKFSETVTGVDVTDFAVSVVSGGITGATVTAVSGAGSDYVVRVDTGTGDGTFRLNVVDDDSIKDFPLNPLGGVGIGNGSFTVGGMYTVDKSIVAATSITRLDPDPSANVAVHFAVNFSEPVTGVDLNDFAPVTTGTITNAAVIGVTGSGSSFTVAVNTGAGDGTLRLDLLDNDSILDAILTPLGGAGASNGNFTSGEIYTINRGAPVVLSILRADANPTIAESVRFNLTFSEAVTGVDASDFVLVNPDGIGSASILTVNGSGSSYTVTVGTGTVNGGLRLDLVDNDSIIDAMAVPLGGAGAANGNFTGETYNINKLVFSYFTTTFRSTGANDGWVLETSENSNVGGTVDTRATTFVLGDNAQNSQYRAILHFPTYYLPDNAVVTRVILTIKKQSVIGMDPFLTHQNIQVDICNGIFGFDGTFGSFSLQPTDFQANASMNSVGVIANNPITGTYWTMLDATANNLINLTGSTQIRLGFQLDDNNDLGDDIIAFHSGDAALLLDRPHLQVEYYVPKW